MANKTADTVEPVAPVILKDQSGWCKLWHPRGVHCTLPLPPDMAQAYAAVNTAILEGWLVREPGLEEGEESDTVAGILRGEHERDGQSTPFLLLYSVNEALKWSFLKVYLNRPEDVAAFESASGMKLKALPVYVGQDKPQRGASRQVDKFIVAPPKTFKVIFKKNPKHDPSTEEGKMKPARLFVRWDGQAATPQAPAHSEPEQGSSDPNAADRAFVEEFEDLLLNCKTMAEYEAAGFAIKNAKGKPLTVGGRAYIGEVAARVKERLMRNLSASEAENSDIPF